MKTKQTFILLVSTLFAALANIHAQTTFTKIISGPIATDQGQFGGAVWADFGERGLLDLLVCDYAGGTNGFYRNNGNGTFVRITQGDPVQPSAYPVVPAALDFDNDGALDLLICAGVDDPSPRPNMLYHNNGDGTFTRISGGGVTNQVGYYNACSVADYDNDGLVDLFIPGQIQSSPNLLFHNEGDGTFKRILSGKVVTDVRDNTSVSWADYDDDGFLDLLVNTPIGNFLYHNTHDGTFTRVLTNQVATGVWADGAWGATWGDYDNDGLLDLFVTGKTSSNRLYHNNGNGVFTNVTAGPMLLPPVGGSSRACAWGDYDNDGYLDLFVASDNATNRLFHNNGDGTFTQVLSGPAVDERAGPYCNACGWVDYDNDGSLDLFVTRATDSFPTSNLLYHNNGNTNAWLEVKLVGSASNRSAIGAKVRLHATIGGKPLWQQREIGNGGGRWINPLVAHFGLGDATNVDLLHIEWPSGITQTLTNVSSKQILTVVEHQQGSHARPEFAGVSRSVGGAVSLSVAGDAGLLYLFAGSTNLVDWTWLGVRSNATGSVQFTDVHAANYSSRFYRVSIP